MNGTQVHELLYQVLETDWVACSCTKPPCAARRTKNCELIGRPTMTRPSTT